MKTTLIASALIALSMAASGSAFAQRGDHGNDHNDRNSKAQQHSNDDARQYRRDDKRGGGPRHDLRRGQRLSQEYRDNRYVVSD